MLIDSHCHLDRLDLSAHSGQLDEIINNAKARDVSEMLCVSVTLEDYPRMLETIAPYDFVYASCGQHPLNQDHTLDPAELLRLADDPRVVAIGETGLDYFYAPDTKALQQESFAEHIQVARQLAKPLIIHTRDAREQTIAMLREGGAADVGGVLHCFTESLEMAKQAMEFGFYISISGIATFRNASELRDVVRALPLERLLIETDSPYLAPVPHRGKQNQPAFVRDVAEFIADLKGVSLETLAEVTSRNFHDLFPLAKKR